MEKLPPPENWSEAAENLAAVGDTEVYRGLIIFGRWYVFSILDNNNLCHKVYHGLKKKNHTIYIYIFQ